MSAIGCQNESSTIPSKPKIQLSRRIVLHRSRRYFIWECMAKMEMVFGFSIFMIGFLLNFLLFGTLSYCVEKIHDNENGKSDRSLLLNNVSEHRNMLNASSTKFMGWFDVDYGNSTIQPIQCNDTLTATYTAMMVCTYLISFYGLTLFWTNYHLVHGLNPKKYFSFLIKWVLLKASLLVGVLTIFEFFAGKLESSLNGLYAITMLYCVYLLFLTWGLYRKLQLSRVYIGRIVPRKRVTASSSNDDNNSNYVPMEFIPFNTHTGKFTYNDKYNVSPFVNNTCAEESIHLNAAGEGNGQRQNDIKININ